MPLMLREIKVLTDLRAFLCPFGAIDMQVLKDLKSQEVVSSCAVRDQAIPNYSYVMLGFRAVARAVFSRVLSLGPSGP